MNCPFCHQPIVRLRFRDPELEGDYPRAHVGGKPDECRYPFSDNTVLAWLLRNKVEPTKKNYRQLAYLEAA